MKQLSLFETTPVVLSSKLDKLNMNREELLRWKQRVFDYQQHERYREPEIQPSLAGDLSLAKAYRLDPFSLAPYSLEFWRLPSCSWMKPGCIYFVIDAELPIVLYIEESRNDPKQRWYRHDCKSYLAQYHDLHSQHSLKKSVRIAFYWDVPPDNSKRRQLEGSLIARWRSP